MSELPNDVRAKVLIVEDDVIVALDLQGMVMRLGYDVVGIVDSGKAAIASAQRFRPDIILLDLILIGPLDGIDVAREIHKSFDVPIIFCTSSTDIAMLVRAKEITYAGYLLKPINPDSLSTTLDTALYEYKLEKRVKEAEARFKGLAEKCELLQYFFDQKASFKWEWREETGVVVSEYPGKEAIQEKIHEFLAGKTYSQDATDRISGLLEIQGETDTNQVFALIGIHNNETGIIHGMLILLPGVKSSSCPPR